MTQGNISLKCVSQEKKNNIHGAQLDPLLHFIQQGLLLQQGIGAFIVIVAFS